MESSNQSFQENVVLALAVIIKSKIQTNSRSTKNDPVESVNLSTDSSKNISSLIGHFIMFNLELLLINQ